MLSLSPNPSLFALILFGSLFLVAGVSLVIRHQMEFQSVLGVGFLFTGVCLWLSQYLNTYVPGIDIAVVILGYMMSIISMIVLHSYIRGKRDVNIKLKKVNPEKEDTQKPDTLVERLSAFDEIRKKSKLVDPQYTGLLRWQIAYVEYKEEKRMDEEKNAVDFIIGQQVDLEQREYE